MKTNKNSGGERNMFSNVCIYTKAVFFSFIFSILIFMIMALLITYTNISESIVPITAMSVMIMSSLLCGIIAGGKMKNKGWLNGALAGLIYGLVILFFSWVLVKDFCVGKSMIVKSGIGIVAGGIGGMIGVNLK